jgi:hypothetical protein
MTDPDRPKSPSPPPPTMHGHPAYDGDVSHPHVSLPRPQPVVRLPPASVSLTPPETSTMKSGPTQARANLPPLRDDLNIPSSLRRHGTHSARKSSFDIGPENWQDKINNLLTGRRSSPPKPPLVESAGRHAWDPRVQSDAATVSLPTPNIASDVGIVASKPMAEECFAEQEMGSLPQIRLPHRIPEAAWQPAPVPNKHLHRKFMIAYTTSADPFDFEDAEAPSTCFRIHLPGMSELKVRVLSSSRSNMRASGTGRPAQRHRIGPVSGYRGGKRDSSNSYPNESAPSLSLPRGRGAYRGRSTESWTRRTPSATTN